MDKQAFIRDMKSFACGAGFINKLKIAKYLKKSHNAIPDLVSGLDRIQDGRNDRYFIPDVAERNMEKVKGIAVE